MIRMVMAAMVGAFFATGIQALADKISDYNEETHEVDEAGDAAYQQKSRTYRLCRYWSRDSSSRGYLCNSIDYYVDVVEQGDLRPMESAIMSNIRRLESLETRVANLESEP